MFSSAQRIYISANDHDRLRVGILYNTSGHELQQPPRATTTTTPLKHKHATRNHADSSGNKHAQAGKLRSGRGLVEVGGVSVVGGRGLGAGVDGDGAGVSSGCGTGGGGDDGGTLDTRAAGDDLEEGREVLRLGARRLDLDCVVVVTAKLLGRNPDENTVVGKVLCKEY